MRERNGRPEWLPLPMLPTFVFEELFYNTLHAAVSFAREHLAHFKCPTSVDVVGALPRTATGKVIKTELREPYWRGHDRRIS